MIDDIIWLITARSGSKSIKNKNIKLLGGYPLFYHVYNSLRKVSKNNNIWGSTDSLNYAKIFNKFGLNTPFIRPEELATDSAKSVDVVLHAMDYAEKTRQQKKYIGLIEPTSPFVNSSDYLNALNLLKNDNLSQSIVATVESRPNTFFIQDEHKYLNCISKNISKNNHKIGRQQFVKQITPSGGFYICEWEKFKNSRTFYNPNTLSYELDEIKGLEIDEPLDWEFAEFIIKKNKDEIIE